MMTLNDNEKNFQKKLQKDTEIPVIVRERANQAYHHIENNTAVQKRETNDKNALRWMKTGGKVVAGTAAVLAAGICALSLFLTGCSGEISNDYVTITKYKGVEIDKVDADAVSDNDVEAQINSVLQSKSTTTEVTDRAAQTGDTVTIDYEGKKDGVAFDGGTATDAQLTLGSGQFIDGFEDGVVGHNIGDTFDLNLTFPENYGNEDLAGQAVVFTVTLKGISQTDLPELTDEFVQSVSDTSKTVEEYKKEIKKSLKKNSKENQQNTIKENAWKAVLENTTVNKYPKKDLKNMISSIKTQYKNMASYYNVDFADFLKQYMNMDEETFNSKATQAAKDQVKANLAADLIIEKAKIDVSDKTLEKKYKEYAKAYGYEDVDALKKALEDAGNLENLEKTARLDIVEDWVADNCKQVKSTSSDSSKSGSNSTGSTGSTESTK
jgi:trigger factor